MRRPAVVRTAAALGLVALLAAPAAAAPEPTPAVDLGGIPVQGSTDTNAPTELTAGLWADTLGKPSSRTEVHQYRYTRTMKDSTVHIGVVGASLDGQDALSIAAVDADGESCGSEDAPSGTPATQTVFGAGVVVGPADPADRNATCLTSPTVAFSLDRGYSSSESDLPVAIKIVEEAPVESSVADLPTPPETPRVATPQGGEPKAVQGAASFEDAPELRSGSTSADTIPEGEVRLYRVRVGWGQQLAVSAMAPQLEQGEDDSYVSAGVDLRLVDPMRNPFGDVVEDAESSGYYGADPLRLFEGTAPVTYLGRFDSAAAALPGDYWVALAVEPPDADQAPVDVPVEIAVQVDGEIRGAPTYAATVQGPGTEAGPEGYTPATPYLVADGVFAADPSGNPAPAPPVADDGLAPRRIAGIVLACASALLCVAGAFRLRRR